MQIACPQCSMQYDIDPRLLPPAGASVQCTRCSFIFTATPSGQVLIPSQPQGAQGRPPPKAGESSRSAVGTTTQVFGSPYTAQGRPPAPNPSTTQVFGAVQPPGPAAAPGATPAPIPAVGKTQVFGAVPMPPQPAPSATTTQVFGAVALPEKAPAVTTTQVFGAVSAPAPLPAAAVTQVFGADSVPAKTPAPSPTTTQVFGAAAVAAKVPASASGLAPTTTQVFGAVSAPAQQAAASPSTTQVFGAVPMPAQPTLAPTTTQVFGAASVPAQQAPGPAQKAPAPATTQVFGAASVPAQQTPAPTQQAPAPTTTQVFGAVAVPAQQAPSVSTTQVFGAAAVSAKAPAPASGLAPTTTQVFGAVPMPAQQPTPATTQTFGSAEVEAARKASRSPTPAPAASGEPVPWMVEPGPAPAPRGVTTERQAASPPAPSISLPEEPVALPAPPHPSFPQEPVVERSGPFAAPRRSASLELPPEMLVPSPPESPRPAPAQQAPSGSGRERILIVLGAVVALGLTAWLSYPVWRDRGAELPAEALSAKDQAVSLLRRDDVVSRDQAIEQLRSLITRYPKFTEAQAELVVALSLQLDDVKVDIAWIAQEEARIQKEISGLELAKSPLDWPSRVNARRRDLEALGEQKRPLDEKVAELTKQLEPGLGFIRAAPETEPSADVVARVKAQAVHAGVQGNPQAISLAERLRQVESPAHWSVLTRVEYGLNAPSPPSALPELAEALAHVREQDKTFLRAYVLGARLALRLKDGATARSLLDTVVALNPNHALARKLQSQAATVAPAP